MWGGERSRRTAVTSHETSDEEKENSRHSGPNKKHRAPSPSERCSLAKRRKIGCGAGKTLDVLVNVQDSGDGEYNIENPLDCGCDKGWIKGSQQRLEALASHGGVPPRRPVTPADWNTL